MDIDKKKPLDIELINKKISIIIEGSMILKLGLHNKNTLFIFFSIFLATILTILLTNFFLTRNYFFKLSDYFYLSIKFGVRDTDIVKNLNITFLILLVLVYLISYPITMLILNFYFNMILINEYTIKAYVMIFLLYTFIFLALLSIQCILNIRSLNKL